MANRIGITVYFLTLIFILATGCGTADNDTPETDSFSSLSSNFSVPPADYSTAPFWVWNDEVTREKIDRDLEAFHSQHIRQLFIHPRPGLITEYLSEEWFSLWKYAYQQAKKKGITVWIYDENSFPSGFGGGHVQREMPESYNQGSVLVPVEITGSEVQQADSFLVILEELGAKGYQQVNNLRDGQTYLAYRVAEPKPDGFFGGLPYVDLLVPGVTEKFIEITMDGYEKILPGVLGKDVPGIFTDEPNISTRANEKGIRWTPTLFEDFQSRWGYDLRPHLPALTRQSGDWKRVRHNYFTLLLELFIERWSEPWFRYTEQQGLKWTGHYWEHGWPSPHHGGDNMAMYAWHQIPGIDMLFNNYQHVPTQFGNVRAVRELGSVANQLGKSRALSETYGAAGWDLSFEDMKRLGDWEYTLGVNFMNQHLSFMTLKGRRKGDFPQSLSHHAPYWDQYHSLADYFHRLSFALTRGKQVNEILVLEPTTSAWMYYNPMQKDNASLNHLDSDFRSLLDQLEAWQIEYDLGSEDIISRNGQIKGKRFLIGQRSYHTVILPAHMENLDSQTFSLIGDFVQGGGKLILLGAVPTRIDGQPNQQLEELFNRSEVHRVQGATLERAAMLQTNRLQVSDSLPLVYHHRRQLPDGDLIFWSNFDTTRHAEFSFQSIGEDVSVLDLQSGKIEPYPFQSSENQIRIHVDLPVAGSKLLFIHAQPYHPSEDKPAPKLDWQTVETGKLHVERLRPNSLAIDYLDLTVGGQSWKNMYFSRASDSAFHLNGLENYGRWGYNPWTVAIQYRTNVLDMGKQFGAGSGFQADYHFQIDGFRPDSLFAVVEWGHLYDIQVNGNPVETDSLSWWLDPTFSKIDISKFIQSGDNLLTLAISPMDIHAEIEPVFILGDFSLKAAEKGFSIAPPQKLQTGSWVDQGMPMYSQSVEYRKTFIAKAEKAHQLVLRDWNGSVARVKVNQQDAGIIGWPPYQLDISNLVQPGQNVVSIEVTGSLQNLLGPHHNSPVKGLVTPWSWFFAPETQPTGADYYLVEYGLFEGFEIQVTNDSTSH